MTSVYGGPAMGAQKAAFQISFTAEAAAMCNEEFGAGLLDLVKAFETVPHHVLVKIAIGMGYTPRYPPSLPGVLQVETNNLC